MGRQRLLGSKAPGADLAAQDLGIGTKGTTTGQRATGDSPRPDPATLRRRSSHPTPSPPLHLASLPLSTAEGAGCGNGSGRRGPIEQLVREGMTRQPRNAAIPLCRAAVSMWRRRVRQATRVSKPVRCNRGHARTVFVGRSPADYRAKRVTRSGCPRFPFFSSVRRFTGVETEARQCLGTLLLHRGQLVGIETQLRQDSRRDLGRFHRGGHHRGRHRRI